jgi:glycosyltransferase involved in cell wall biosynthesis
MGDGSGRGSTRFGLYLADLDPARNDSAGTINYALGLADALPLLLAPGERLFVLANPTIAEAIPTLADRDSVELDLVPMPTGAVSRLMRDHFGALRWARRRRLDTIHFPKGHIPIRPARGISTVATLHDDIAVRYASGELGRAGHHFKRLYFRWAVTHSLRQADRILTVSQFSAEQLAGLVSDHGSPAVVTYEGVSLPPHGFVPLAARTNLIVVIGSPFPHKQTYRSVSWAMRFIHGAPDAGLRLVVTGRLDRKTEELCEAQPITRVPVALSAADLSQLLASARALVFGSTYEGFGLPPVEAYSLGTPATYVEVGAMREIMAGFPGGHEQTYASFAVALDTVLRLRDAELGALQSQMQQRYDWRDVALRTLDVYRAGRK